MAVSSSAQAQNSEQGEIRLGVLQSGTVHWELQAMQYLKLDQKHGFKLHIQPYANLSATRLALTGGNVDGIVSDWLWAGQRQNDGQPLWFLPYSSSIGRVMVAADSPLLAAGLSDADKLVALKGKRVGIAGGPYSKGWMLLQSAAKAQGIALKKQVTLKFGAPPLLSAEFRRGNLDVLVTFWHYGERLEAEGYRTLFPLKSLAQSQGLSPQTPMLGYIFSRNWVTQNTALAQAFSKAVRETKSALAADAASVDQPLWKQLRPMMKATDQRSFEGLQRGYLAGIPTRMNDEGAQSASRFYQLIDQARPRPQGQPLPLTLFDPRF